LGRLSAPNPSFSDICKVRKFYKISVRNAQGSRGIIVAELQIGAVKALREKERQGETQEPSIF
jgi:hypothetical protein